MLVQSLRLAKSIIMPSKKKGMNTRSLDYLRLVACDKTNTTLIASFPSSGWNWTTDVTTYAVVKHLTGEYKIEYKESGQYKGSEVKPVTLFHPADARAAKAPPLSQLGIPRDYCLHTHGYRGESPLWGLDRARTIMVARDIPSALYSYYAKRRDVYATFEECLHDGILERAVRFYESWSGVPKEIFWYEDFKVDPIGQFTRFAKSALSVEVPAKIVAEAVEFYSFEEQKKREFKFNPDEKKHFHFKAKASYREEMGEALYDFIRGRIQHIQL